MKRQKKKRNVESYPMEDRAMKEAARFMGEELLPLLGVEGSVRRVSPTEAVFLEVGDYGTVKELIFTSDLSKSSYAALSSIGVPQYASFLRLA